MNDHPTNLHRVKFWPVIAALLPTLGIGFLFLKGAFESSVTLTFIATWLLPLLLGLGLMGLAARKGLLRRGIVFGLVVLTIPALPVLTGNRLEGDQHMQTELLEVAIAEGTPVDHLDLQIHAFSEAVARPALEVVQDAFAPVVKPLACTRANQSAK